MLRQRSPQLVQIRFWRFRARESPCMAHKRQKHCLQLIPDVFMHRQLAQLRLSSEKEQFCHHFDVSPYWSRWLTPRDFQWDLVDIFEMTNVSGFLFSKKCSNFFWSRIFGQDFFLTYALCDFLSTEHVFESTPAFRKALSRYLLGGAAKLKFGPSPCGDLWLSPLRFCLC